MKRLRIHNILYLYLKNKNVSISTLPQLLMLLELENQQKPLSLQSLSTLLQCKISTLMNDIDGLLYNTSYNQKRDPKKGVILRIINKETKELNEKDEFKINKEFQFTKAKFNTLPLTRKKTASELEVIAKQDQMNIQI